MLAPAGVPACTSLSPVLLYSPSLSHSRMSFGDVINLNAQIPYAIRITIAVEVKTIGAVEFPLNEVVSSDDFRDQAQVVRLCSFGSLTLSACGIARFFLRREDFFN